MKHLHLATILLGISLSAQTQTRTSLLEEFTGENCLPCAAYNPALDALLAQPANAAKIIALKWQVPIPSAPSNPTSLFQTNKPEITWRYTGAGIGGYGYPCQSTPAGVLTDGVTGAPTCLIDGRNQWAFGVPGNHPYYLTSNAITAAASAPTPFSIHMATAWDATFDNCVVTVTVSSSAAFSAAGNLMFRLCLVERRVEFQTAPGTNDERIFHDVVRKSYPTTGATVVTGMGTPLPAAWTGGQTQVLTINCAIPSYIMDKSEMAFVGFVQDDGDKKIYQAARTSQPSIPNDAKAGAIQLPLVACSNFAYPSVTIHNNGPNAITALTITPTLDGLAGVKVYWTGNLAPATSTSVPMNTLFLTAGSHTYACTISDVSGGDMVSANNKQEHIFLSTSTYFKAPYTQSFESGMFPPPNWLVLNSGGMNSFENSSNGGGYGTSGRSLGYQLYSALKEEVDEILIPPLDLVGILNSKLSFDLAYQGKTGDKDSLKVFISSDCGASWVNIYANGGSAMATAPYTGNAVFYPSASEWTTVAIPLDTYVTWPQVLIKFQVRTDQGSGVYIDNINLEAGNGNPPGTGLAAAETKQVSFSLHPNPAGHVAVLGMDPEQPAPMQVEITNALGKTVYKASGQPASGKLTLDCSDLPAGIYLVKVSSEKGSGIKKLVIAR